MYENVQVILNYVKLCIPFCFASSFIFLLLTLELHEGMNMVGGGGFCRSICVANFNLFNSPWIGLSFYALLILFLDTLELFNMNTAKMKTLLKWEICILKMVRNLIYIKIFTHFTIYKSCITFTANTSKT